MYTRYAFINFVDKFLFMFADTSVQAKPQAKNFVLVGWCSTHDIVQLHVYVYTPVTYISSKYAHIHILCDYNYNYVTCIYYHQTNKYIT